MKSLRIPFYVALFLLLISGSNTFAQGKLYTARGYWEETRNETYRTIQKKVESGDSLSDNEKGYLQDYELFLASYFNRMTADQKEDYDRLKGYWNTRLTSDDAKETEVKDFEWRGRDRLANGLYGLWYGSSIVSIGEITGAASVGLPLVTSGLWMLGPALNPMKYKGITRNTVRASNTGKLLGLGYGAALGLALAGGSEDYGKWSLGLSSVGSILLGEVAFYAEEKKNLPAGHIEIMRHYGFLGPWVGFAIVAGTGSDNRNAIGAGLLAGGISGLIIGNGVASKYNYTRGDADAISSLTLISTGIGFAAVTETYNNNEAKSLLMVPAAASVIGSVWAQRAVKGAHLTDRQGSTLNLAVGGAALIGLGVVFFTKSESPAVWLGVPSGLALFTHQLLLHNYKTTNMEMNIRGKKYKKRSYSVSLKVTPEGYFLNKQIPLRNYSPQLAAQMQNPLLKLVVRW